MKSIYLLTLGFLTACIQYRTQTVAPATYQLPGPRTIATPLDSLWPAAIDVVNERQLSIKLVDKASGLVQSERMWAGSDSLYWDCAKTRLLEINTARGDTTVTYEGWERNPTVTITISAVPSAGATLLRVTANVSATCNSRGLLEREILDAIEARWKELRGR